MTLEDDVAVCPKDERDRFPHCLLLFVRKDVVQKYVENNVLDPRQGGPSCLLMQQKDTCMHVWGSL